MVHVTNLTPGGGVTDSPASDDRGVGARGARGEDVVLRQHQRVAQYFHELLVQEAHVPGPEESSAQGDQPESVDGSVARECCLY